MSGKLDALLFASLATAAEWRMDDFKVQELANIAWAFATAGRNDVSLFASLATAAEGPTRVATYVNSLTSFQTLANIDLQTAAEARTFV